MHYSKVKSKEIDILHQEIKKHKDVTVRNLGRFKVKTRKGRIQKNFEGKEIKVPTRKRVVVVLTENIRDLCE